MTDSNHKAGDSSTAVNPSLGLPNFRTKYTEDPELSHNTTYPQLYEVGQEVYFEGPRGVDPKPYKIRKALGEGSYELERDGKCDYKPYPEDKLQTHP